jgi:hypothetical protein
MAYVYYVPQYKLGKFNVEYRQQAERAVLELGWQVVVAEAESFARLFGHDALHEFVKKRDSESSVAMVRAVDHALGDE